MRRASPVRLLALRRNALIGQELVRIGTGLMSGRGTEAEQDAALEELQARVLHPRVSDLTFWPSQEGPNRDLTPDEVVDAALAYRPIEL